MEAKWFVTPSLQFLHKNSACLSNEFLKVLQADLWLICCQTRHIGSISKAALESVSEWPRITLIRRLELLDRVTSLHTTILDIAIKFVYIQSLILFALIQFWATICFRLHQSIQMWIRIVWFCQKIGYKGHLHIAQHNLTRVCYRESGLWDILPINSWVRSNIESLSFTHNSFKIFEHQIRFGRLIALKLCLMDGSMKTLFCAKLQHNLTTGDLRFNTSSRLFPILQLSLTYVTPVKSGRELINKIVYIISNTIYHAKSTMFCQNWTAE